MKPQLVQPRKIPLKSRASRGIPKLSKKNFVGELVFTNKTGDPQRLGFASLLEYKAALCLIYRPDFADIEEQLPELPFTLPNGKRSRHTFDFRYTTIGQRRICISVKPEWEAQEYEYRSKIEAIERAAIGNICDAVTTITDRNIHPIELHTAKLFHAARYPEPDLDAKIEEAIMEIKGPVTINAFLAEQGLLGRGFFSTVRAIRAGHARKFNMEKITGSTLIEKAA